VSRGTYGPLDRDRHFVIGWGTDQAVGYGVAKAMRPIHPVLDVNARAVGGVRHMVRGARAVGTRSSDRDPGITTSIAMFLGSVGMVWGFLALHRSLRDMRDMVD